MQTLCNRWARSVRRCALPATSALLTLVAATTTAWADTSGSPKIRIVACDEQVQSHKRGVCANHLAPEDFKALAPGVSWWYNWHFDTQEQPPQGVPMEFIPQVWGNNPKDLDGLEKYLANHTPHAIFTLNEPNLRGQAFITPEASADFYIKVKAIGDKHHLPVVGPHMALGSATNASIKALDPIEKKEITYTSMEVFLKAFMFYAGKTEIGGMGVHSYGNTGELQWAMGLVHKDFNCPVWVTEFAQWKTPNAAAGAKYLVQAVDMLERTPYVSGYAWFKERVDSNPSISLFEKGPGKLTPMGKAYVAMPVHDADVFYRLPGRLPAANYVNMEKSEITPTSDADGFLEMDSSDAGSWIEYNVQVDKAGEYTVKVRASGSGKIEWSKAGQSLASVSPTGKEWQTLETTVQLSAGPQTLRVNFAAKGIGLEWIEFQPR